MHMNKYAVVVVIMKGIGKLKMCGGVNLTMLNQWRGGEWVVCVLGVCESECEWVKVGVRECVCGLCVYMCVMCE